MNIGPACDCSGNSATPGVTSLLVHVSNLAEISLVYGEAVASAVLDELCVRSRVFFEKNDVAVSVSLDGHDIRLAGLSLCDLFSDGETVLCALAFRPIIVDGFAILVSLSSQGDGSGMGAPVPRLRRIEPDIYASMMNEAVVAFEAMAEGRLFLAFQPIQATDGSDLLYRECFSRIKPMAGVQEFIAPSNFIPAIEWLGLVRLFDRFVALATIDALRAAPLERLGCNISAQSAVDDVYWASIFNMLAVEPELAARLVVEITETSALPDSKAARKFVARLHHLGCQVAVDDFGVGFSSIRQIVALRPDIIKVDGGFLLDAVEKVFGDEFLSKLIALSSCLAAHVVVEGVEDERRMVVAHAAGAQWVQGYYIARPSEFRDWSLKAVSAAEVAGRVKIQDAGGAVTS